MEGLFFEDFATGTLPALPVPFHLIFSICNYVFNPIE